MNRTHIATSNIPGICATTLLLFAAIGMGCKQPRLSDRDPELHLQAGQEICEKMIRCLRPYTRTIHEEYRQTITVEACSKSIKEMVKARGTWTPAETALARSCYEKELNADCRTFLALPITDPDCLRLTMAQNGLR